MDEVDGMSGGDRGGTQALINIIKRTEESLNFFFYSRIISYSLVFCFLQKEKNVGRFLEIKN